MRKSKKIKSKNHSDFINLLDLALIKSGSITSLAKIIGASRQSITGWYDGVTSPNRGSIARVRYFVNNGEIKCK